jgi:phosphate uptake regulator
MVARILLERIRKCSKYLIVLRTIERIGFGTISIVRLMAYLQENEILFI